jgi:hypothetical protein
VGQSGSELPEILSRRAPGFDQARHKSPSLIMVMGITEYRSTEDRNCQYSYSCSKFGTTVIPTRRPPESISTDRTLASEPGLCALQPVLPASAAMAPPHQRVYKPRNTKSKRSQILLTLSSSCSLTFVWARFLERRAAGTALPSATKPQVSKISRVISVILVVQG